MSDASVGNPAQTAAIETLTDQVLELIESGTPTPIILVDGRTGSGKTTFAAALQNRLFQKGESAPRVIHMDDLYEGWDGLQAGVDYLIRQILSPLGRREGHLVGWPQSRPMSRFG
ncbi:MAG: hypothetical protein RJA60_740 [Actinomycetota bacterium]